MDGFCVRTKWNQPLDLCVGSINGAIRYEFEHKHPVRRQHTMSFPKIVACILFVAVLAATCMYGLNALLIQPIGPTTRVLFIGGGASESWLRILEGARAAAHDFNVEMRVEMPIADNRPDEQIAMVREIDPANCDGVAFCPTEPESQLELVNGLAARTKLVTIGKDAGETRRLCHVGFSPASAGRMVANLARAQFLHGGKVALLNTVYSDADRDTKVGERLLGFKEECGELAGDDSPIIVHIPVDLNEVTQMTWGLPATLADAELVCIVAFDTRAAEAALAALAQRSPGRHVPLIAFDPSAVVLDAIDDGRVDFAISEDEYRDGYEAVKQLARYCRGDAMELPVAGHGKITLCGEVVMKSNLSAFRRRMQTRPVPALAAVAQLQASGTKWRAQAQTSNSRTK